MLINNIKIVFLRGLSPMIDNCLNGVTKIFLKNGSVTEGFVWCQVQWVYRLRTIKIDYDEACMMIGIHWNLDMLNAVKKNSLAVLKAFNF